MGGPGTVVEVLGVPRKSLTSIVLYPKSTAKLRSRRSNRQHHQGHPQHFGTHVLHFSQHPFCCDAYGASIENLRASEGTKAGYQYSGLCSWKWLVWSTFDVSSIVWVVCLITGEAGMMDTVVGTALTIVRGTTAGPNWVTFPATGLITFLLTLVTLTGGERVGGNKLLGIKKGLFAVDGEGLKLRIRSWGVSFPFLYLVFMYSILLGVLSIIKDCGSCARFLILRGQRNSQTTNKSTTVLY